MVVYDDDADEKWIYQKHTRHKHDILQYYLNIWINKLSNASDTLRIVDCFAGRAEYVDSDDAKPMSLESITPGVEYPGSPLIILDKAIDRLDVFDHLELICIENEDENFEYLDNNISPYEGQFDEINITTICGEFQNEIREAIIDSGGAAPPTFLFADPYNVRPLEYDLITDLLTTLEKPEILMNLNADYIVRFKDTELHEANLRSLYGLDDWREEIREFQPTNLEHPEVEYYCHERLEGSGPEHTLAYMITEADTSQMKYYLVFGTNESEGLRFMKNSMQRVGDSGKLAYAPERSGYGSGQAKLSDSDSYSKSERARNYLLNRFVGQTDGITYTELIRKCHVDRTYDDTRESDYHAALSELEEEGVIEVDRRTSKETGIQGDDLLIFPDEIE